MPTVSVIIASYNHARYIPETLESILAQTYQDYEIVVVDDGSSDESWSVLERCAAQDCRIRIFAHPNRMNRGVSATVNVAIRNTTGKYIAWLGSDDVWGRGFLVEQVRVLERNGSIGFVCGRAYTIDGSGARLPLIHGVDITQFPDPLWSMILDCRIAALTAVFRRECIDRVGGLDERLEYSDWELWMRILSLWKPGFTSEPNAYYRVHGSNMSVGVPRERTIERVVAVLLALRQKAPVVGGRLMLPANRSLIDLQLAAHAYCAGQNDEMRSYFHSAMSCDPAWLSDVDRWVEWLRFWRINRWHMLEGRVRPFCDCVGDLIESVAGQRVARRVSRRIHIEMLMERAKRALRRRVKWLYTGV